MTVSRKVMHAGYKHAVYANNVFSFPKMALMIFYLLHNYVTIHMYVRVPCAEIYMCIVYRYLHIVLCMSCIYTRGDFVPSGHTYIYLRSYIPT